MRVFAASLVVGLMFALGSSLHASAAPDGILVITPSTGTITTPVTLSTAGVCEQGVGFVVAVQGKGISDEAGNLVGMTMLDSLPRDPRGVHTVAPTASLGEYFLGAAGTLPTGKYDIVFACRNKLDLEWLQTFTATIKVAKDGTYTALADAAGPLDELLADMDFTPPPIAPGDDAMIMPPTEADSQSSETQVVTVAAQQPNDDSLRIVLIGAGAVLLGGAAMAWFIMRRRESDSKDDTDSSVVSAR